MARLSKKTQEEVIEITSEFVRKVKLVFGDKLKKVILLAPMHEETIMQNPI